MIAGRFGDIGELLFEIELIGADGESYPVEVLLDKPHVMLSMLSFCCL